MPFRAKQWHNRLSEYPSRRRLVPAEGEDEGLFDVQRAEGEVHQPGDTFDAESMNDLEVRIGEGLEGLEEELARLGHQKADTDRLEAHEASLDNPHHVTPGQIGALPAEDDAQNALRLQGHDTAYFAAATDLENMAQQVEEAVLAAAAGLVPSGVMAPYAGKSVPAGWLLCDGRAVSRLLHAGLFLAIGTTYGAGDGLLTFNLPNTTDRFVMGGDTTAVGREGGAAQHVLTAEEMPAHSHDMKAVGPYMAMGNEGWSFNAGGALVAAGIVAPAGGGQAHNNLPPYVQIPYIIKS